MEFLVLVLKVRCSTTELYFTKKVSYGVGNLFQYLAQLQNTLPLLFRVYLGVNTCEIFLCLGVIVCVLYIVLGSLLSCSFFVLRNVTGEFHRFSHRVIFLLAHIFFKNEIRAGIIILYLNDNHTPIVGRSRSKTLRYSHHPSDHTDTFVFSSMVRPPSRARIPLLWK